jgi:hypothetical protein
VFLKRYNVTVKAAEAERGVKGAGRRKKDRERIVVGVSI